MKVNKVCTPCRFFFRMVKLINICNRAFQKDFYYYPVVNKIVQIRNGLVN